MAGVVTYHYPVAGSTAPTAAQIADLSMLTAQVVFTDADTVATVTHNMAAAGAANQFPLLHYRFTGTPTTTVSSPIGLVNTDSNTVTVNKPTITGSACTIEVVVLRPNTSIQ